MSFSAFQVLVPQGKTGEVDVTVKMAGYNQKVLEAAQITNPVSFIHTFWSIDFQ
jgi:hypothetical protein